MHNTGCSIKERERIDCAKLVVKKSQRSWTRVVRMSEVVSLLVFNESCAHPVHVGLRCHLLRIALRCFASQAVSSSGQHLLLGGEGVQPSIWDLAAGSKLWQAKGGKPHRQTLLVDKPFTTAVAFLPDSSSSDSSAEHAAAAADEDAGDEAAAAAVKLRFVAGSASSKVHVYDTAAGRRPQKEVVFGETRVTALAPEHDGECATANSFPFPFVIMQGQVVGTIAPSVVTGQQCICRRCSDLLLSPVAMAKTQSLGTHANSSAGLA
jgi:hypothetical protein